MSAEAKTKLHSDPKNRVVTYEETDKHVLVEKTDSKQSLKFTTTATGKKWADRYYEWLCHDSTGSEPDWLNECGSIITETEAPGNNETGDTKKDENTEAK